VRNGGQLGVEHAGEGEQVVTLVLQGDAHRADAPRVGNGKNLGRYAASWIAC
jgi:hypothetical protein